MHLAGTEAVAGDQQYTAPTAHHKDRSLEGRSGKAPGRRAALNQERAGSRVPQVHPAPQGVPERQALAVLMAPTAPEVAMVQMVQMVQLVQTARTARLGLRACLDLLVAMALTEMTERQALLGCQAQTA